MFKKQIEKIGKIEGPVVIYDEGHEVFGIFKNGKEAAEAIKGSNPSWWGSVPVAEAWENGGKVGETVILTCGCEIAWSDWEENLPVSGTYARCPAHGDEEVQ